MYAKCFKRVIDFLLSLMAICVLSPVLLILIVVTAIAMKGNPFFTQLRPGRIDKKTGKEKIFRMIKFRTMTNEKDENGNLLPDEVRLNKFGKILRSTSLDELPELFNILKGDMAIIGPRPQLVRDMVFMTSAERQRHSVRPGLSRARSSKREKQHDLGEEVRIRSSLYRTHYFFGGYQNYF